MDKVQTGSQPAPAPDAVLEIRNLNIRFATSRGSVQALRNIDLSIPRRSVVGAVGESGSGKTTLISAAMNLLPDNAEIHGGEVLFEGEDVLRMNKRALQDMRGRRISMVFQDPMTAMNPVLTIGTQMADIQYRDRALSKAEKRRKAADVLRRVGIPDPMQRLDNYPHEFSGGMRQRICIAMALLSRPELLIADEPTTALDVTTEAQIIHLLRELQKDYQSSILFISHNLGLIAELCDYVVILYAGTIVEQGPVHDIFHRPQHPYTEALLVCDPALLTETSREMPTIPGNVPDLTPPPPGCIFASRCPKAFDRCHVDDPAVTFVSERHSARCHLIGSQENP